MKSIILEIKDSVNNIQFNYLYKFYKITNYKKILEDLPKIYDKYNKKYTTVFLNHDDIIEDLCEYILPGDKISLEIYNSETVYFIFDGMSNIFESKYINEVYKFYRNEKLEGEILLYKRTGLKLFLIDVLINPDEIMNKCINRMIKKYNY